MTHEQLREEITRRRLHLCATLAASGLSESDAAKITANASALVMALALTLGEPSAAEVVAHGQDTAERLYYFPRLRGTSQAVHALIEAIIGTWPGE